MRVTQQGSMKVYDAMVANPPKAPVVTRKPLRPNRYKAGDKSTVALVHSDNRSTALEEALKLLGGLDPILEGLEGTVLIKPNCNTDDPFPASSHPEMIRQVAERLIDHGVQPSNIVIGEMSGKGRGLPTRCTMENMGLAKIAKDLALRLNPFEEEEWITVKPPKAHHWPEGIRIPRQLYEASRVINVPAMKTHMSADFTLGLKAAVGLIDAQGRDWLHNGEAFSQKIAELNLVYSADLTVLDGIKCFTTRGPSEGKLAEPGIVIVGGDRVAVDAVGVALLKQLGAVNIAERKVAEHVQLTWAAELGLGNLNPDKIEVRAANPEKDPTFQDTVSAIKKNLRS